MVNEQGQVLLSRRYATVERRVQRRHRYAEKQVCSRRADEKDDLQAGLSEVRFLPYASIAVPSDDIFSETFRNDFLNRFRHGYDPNYPIIALRGHKKSHDVANQESGAILLWPLIAVHRSGLFLVALPEVDGFLYPKDRNASTAAAVQLPCTTAALEFLEQLYPKVDKIAPHFCETGLADINCYLCSVIPFGVPIQSIAQKTPRRNQRSRGQYTQKRPAWKPEILENSSQFLQISVEEVIDCMVYGKPNINDVNIIRGALKCSSSLNGVPEVSLLLDSPSALDSVTLHSCAYPPGGIASKNIIFSPPLGDFQLAQYVVSEKEGEGAENRESILIYGRLRVEQISATRMDVQLYIRWNVQLPAEARVREFNVRIPVRGNRLISHHNLTVTTGSVAIRDRGKAQDIVWIPGKKLMRNETDAMLSGTIDVQPLPYYGQPEHEPLLAAPALMCGMNSGDRSLFSLRPTDLKCCASPLHQKATSLPKATGENRRAEEKEFDLEPTLQPRFPAESFSSWNDYALDDLSGSELGGTSKSKKNSIPVHKRDPLLMHVQVYAAISFNIDGFSKSGMTVDRNAIAIQPSTNATVRSSQNLRSGTYLIWNCIGEARSAVSSPLSCAGNDEDNA